MSSRWPGSLINKTAPTSSGGGAGDSAPGVWTLDQANPYIATQTWPGTGTPDPQFQYVTALLHGDGTNGGQNNTFLDSSSNNFTITRNGNTTQGSFSPYGSLWSNYFSGSSYLKGNTSISLGSGNFTVEAWAYMPTSGTGTAGNLLFNVGADNTSTGCTFYQYQNSVRIYGNNTNILTVSYTFTPNVWYHFAFVRNSGILTIYINGAPVGTVSISNTFSGNPLVNCELNGSTYYPGDIGYISNVRATTTAVYTSAFTPSTTPLTAISGTVFLSAQSNCFIDNSSNNATITVTGTPSVQRFSPFQNLATYQTAKIGGSGYFDGSGDCLANSSSTTLSGDFTFESWIYLTSIASSNAIFAIGDSIGSSGFEYLVNSSGNIRLYSNNAYLNTVTAGIKANAWYHIAVVRTSGSIKTYLNGVLLNTISNSSTFSGNFYVGAEYYNSTLTPLYSGYITDSRVTNTVVYSANFTPPTLPLTAISGTKFLLNYTNGSIYDNAAMNDLETVGNAQISTSVVKYGTGSMSFNGTNSNFLLPLTAANILGSANFTIEFWINPNNVSSYQYIYCTESSAYYSASILLTNAGKINISLSNNGSAVQLNLTGNVVLSIGSWYHVACTRVGTTVNIFVNGNLDTSGTFSGAIYNPGSPFTIGARSQYPSAPSSYVNGYLDDFRITNGYARYWFNFQPPAAPYPNYGGTLQLTYDPYFENTTLLLNGEGTNGAQNNTFLDSSTNNFTITRNGNTTQGSFSPYGNLWGNYFDGSGDYLSTPNSANLVLNASDFTVECWVNVSTLAALQRLMVWSNGTGSDVNYSWTMDIQTSGIPRCYIGSFGGINAPGAVNIGSWNHIAIVRSGSAITVYLNGKGGAASSPSVQAVSDGTLTIGADRSGGSPTTGYISNIRILKGTALYTANFTPPTTPLTAITNTQLLTCQSNRFVDNSTNAFTLTVSGNTSVQRFSPFNPTSTYSTSVIGGSGYFDGSGDSLVVAANSAFGFGTGDFTVEFWINPLVNGNSGGTTLFDFRATATGIPWVLYVKNTGSGNYIGAYTSYGATSLEAQSAFTPLNSWSYVVVQRTSGTWAIYVNGTSASLTGSGYNGDLGSSKPLTIALSADGTSNPYTGYISNVRIVKGTAVYSGSTITVPTAPLSTVTNTQLLCNFTNAGIPDLAMQNNLETVGNAQVSTTQYKYGSSSLYFDGSGDTLNASIASSKTSGNLAGDFTIECWAYFNSVSITQGIAAFSDTGGWNGWQLASSSSLSIYFEFLNSSGAAAGAYSASGLLATNTWYHIAVCRVGSAITIYLNGRSVASTTYSGYTTGSSSFVALGSDRTKTSNYFNGYIDDFRITNGVARYAQPFTPPTAALPTY